MKQMVLFLGLLAMVGCANSRQEAINRALVPALSDVTLENRPAAALAFAPPITLGMPALDLSRAGREPEAFWGYSQGVTDSYDVLQDDIQYTDPWSGAYRESFNERTGTSFR